MINPVCQSCGCLLADKEIDYEEGSKKINNSKISDKEKAKQKKKLLDDLGLKRYCCRLRMITSINQAELIK